jgi:hypothetical protein
LAENEAFKISEDELYNSVAENMKNMALNIERLVTKIEAY